MSGKKIICVVGPTGCGKTKMGVLLAKKLGGEVVSCDSMQIYRGMVIGTAAPTAEETEGIPHHMVGVADPGEEYSVARYAREAGACVEDIFARGKQPIIVGGTGLYLDALIRGQDFAGGMSGGKVREELYARLGEKGLDALYEELKAIDPAAAERLHPNDEKRIVRALEVWYETGKTITQHNEETKAVPPRYEPIYLGFAYEDREEMKRVIDLRVDKMVEEGLFEEVEALLARGLPTTTTALAAIGYKECIDFFEGRRAKEETVAEIKLRSRQYAKRQLTWLRRNEAIHWFHWQQTRDFAAAEQFSTKILKDYGVC
ncbi:MAG: tRNA (adenosine(37)-N6)-dimethylallyltransferase MiaA [Oscillospiraceae bacterium]|nr:tRNA (adenosine(37)-N6)-dimethylallyltransferase MiaA [Oscillospiraceae bacterium]